MMPSYQVVEVGSLNIEDAHIRLGKIETDNLTTLGTISSDYNERGNKFVTAEHFVDKDGNPVNEKQFDIQKMCYSMFVSPVRNKGRHCNVIPHHQSNGFRDRLGEITGGGLIRIQDNTLRVEDFSGDYKGEPPYLRDKFARLLRDALSKKFNEPALELEKSTAKSTDYYSIVTNPYWLRYVQVLECARKKLDTEIFARELNLYNENEERKARSSR